VWLKYESQSFLITPEGANDEEAEFLRNMLAAALLGITFRVADF
jgi:hypothetical protein